MCLCVCFLCHSGICFNCREPGHKLEDCPYARGAAPERTRACLRCGKYGCAASNQGDWFRYEGGCDSNYSRADLQMARCFVCGHKGHLCCKPQPSTAPQPSCWNCGGSHWAEDCKQSYQGHLMAERLQDRRKLQHKKQQGARLQATAAAAAAGNSWGTGGYDMQDTRQQQFGGGGYGGGRGFGGAASGMMQGYNSRDMYRQQQQMGYMQQQQQQQMAYGGQQQGSWGGGQGYSQQQMGGYGGQQQQGRGFYQQQQYGQGYGGRQGYR